MFAGSSGSWDSLSETDGVGIVVGIAGNQKVLKPLGLDKLPIRAIFALFKRGA